MQTNSSDMNPQTTGYKWFHHIITPHDNKLQLNFPYDGNRQTSYTANLIMINDVRSVAACVVDSHIPTYI